MPQRASPADQNATESRQKGGRPKLPPWIRVYIGTDQYALTYDLLHLPRETPFRSVYAELLRRVQKAAAPAPTDDLSRLTKEERAQLDFAVNRLNNLKAESDYAIKRGDHKSARKYNDVWREQYKVLADLKRRIRMRLATLEYREEVYLFSGADSLPKERRP